MTVTTTLQKIPTVHSIIQYVMAEELKRLTDHLDLLLSPWGFSYEEHFFT